MRFRNSLFRAEDKAHWRILARLHPVLLRVVQKEVHLTSISVSEPAYLQIDDDETA